MNLFNQNQKDYSEKYLESVTKNRLRYSLLITLLLVLIFLVLLSFLAGYLAPLKFESFNDLANLTASGILSIITGIIGFFYGIEAGKKPEITPITDKK